MASTTLPPTPDSVTTLALAVVASSQTPLLLLDGELSVLAASASFCRAFDLDPALVADRPIFDLGRGEWNLPRLRSLLTAVGSGGAAIPAYELTLVRPGQGPRDLVLNANRLVYSEGTAIRLLVTVSDVTDARAAEAFRDALVREKDTLVQAVQHRVANSLQIIASVLLQNARQVQAEDTRGDPRDAEHRATSVAGVQRQLTQSSRNEVLLRPYFTQLCQSLGASMIGDHDQLRIEVTGDDSATTAEVSVSLGLIVTELVINALKHAFPDDRKGLITVDYHAGRDGWALSIRDDGVGMRGTGVRPTARLGTSIVQALAAQLASTITVTDLEPGTGVTIVHAGQAGTPGRVRTLAGAI